MEDKDKLIAQFQKKIEEQAKRINALEQEIALLEYQNKPKKQ
jgi:cell division protein FtsB